jgi:ATP-dependent helicase/nuclease subunit B
MPLTRRFLGWDRPVLELVAEQLLAEASQPVLDLSHLMVVVPTRNAGRRLREMLAHLTARDNRAICPPRVVPPEFLLSLISPSDTGGIASPQEALLGWSAVLGSISFDDFPALFPVPPATRDFRWALSSAKSLNELRSTLGEAGLSIADACRSLSGNLEEEARWEDLARLEERLVQTLAAFGKGDLLTLRQSNLHSPTFPPGITGIRLAACPDPVPLALQVLQGLNEVVPVEVWIHAPESMSDCFDGWGRPVPEVWLQRRIDFPLEEAPVHVLAGPDGQAALAGEAILRCEEPSATVTVGVLDEEVTGPLRRLLERGGRPPFDPAGSSLRSEGVLHLLRIFRDLLAEESYESFAELLRCPDFDAHLTRTLTRWDGPSAVWHLDRTHRRHLFPDLSAARRCFAGREDQSSIELVGALDEAGQLLAKLRQAPRATSLLDVLRHLLSPRLGSAAPRIGRIYQTVSEALQPLVEAIEGPLGACLDLTEIEIFDLLLTFLEQEKLYEERLPGSVELLGWLELHWDEAPQLIVTGFNEGFVPESITGDVYLPESLRKRLAERSPFSTNESRLARDAYLFEAIHQCRRAQGRVDLCLGRHSRDGNPLRPSRLLFLCPDEQLAHRVKSLFHDAPPPRNDLPWTPGFQLQPFPGDPPKFEPVQLSITAFKTYLNSPFHFYLTQVENMEPFDAGLREMDGSTFGNFCHEVLRRFGSDPEVRDSSDASVIKAYLLRQAMELAHLWFGPHPTLPIRMQLQGALARLARAAEVQAETRAEGWVIIETELNLKEPGFHISDILIKGRIDRIDRHETKGTLRVLDYKTADQGEKPEKAHLSKVTKRTNTAWLPDYACFQRDTSILRWKDLQLPLYRLGLAEKYGNDIECGYFNLPKSPADTGVFTWPGLGTDEVEAALTCAKGIIHDLRAGRFWPARLPKYTDSVARLHLGLPEKTIAFDNLIPPTLPHEIPAE